MSEGDRVISNGQVFLPIFAPEFLEDHARRIVKDPSIALIELVANCWDAGADSVDIVWPEDSKPDPIKISDNGTGMTYDEFVIRWRQLNYNRSISQGEDVVFPPDNQSSHRKAFGRNGKGRHSVFCFASQYNVETWCDGEVNKFEVKRTDSIAKAPYQITHHGRAEKQGHGTIISTTLARNYISIASLRDLIGSKFVTDPAFEVYVNGELVELTDLKHLLDIQKIEISGVGTVVVSQVDTQKTSRTSHPHGVAWWVNKRLVGEPSWDDFDDDNFLDKRTIKARRYTFVVEANILKGNVREDWSGFWDTVEYRAVRSAVQEHIRRRLLDLMRDIHKEKKRAAIIDNIKTMRGLPSDSRFYIGEVINGLQERMPSVRQEILRNTVEVLVKLERTRSGYTLLEQLARLHLDELDDLSDILSNWSVQEARLVLGELEWRLKLIERLEQLVEDHSSDELHEIQPLFKRGLWIFGPEYESVHFTSNQTLLTVMRDLLKDNSGVQLSKPRIRPDFVVLSDSTVGVYASDNFDKRGEVDGIDKVLVLELKRGGSRIGIDEHRQGENYALELRKSGKVQNFTEIVVFVLGTEVEADVIDDLNRGKINVRARSYGVILRQAHARTFHLLKKMKEIRVENLLDTDIEEVLGTTRQHELFTLVN